MNLAKVIGGYKYRNGIMVIYQLAGISQTQTGKPLVKMTQAQIGTLNKCRAYFVPVRIADARFNADAYALGGRVAAHHPVASGRGGERSTTDLMVSSISGSQFANLFQYCFNSGSQESEPAPRVPLKNSLI